MRVFYGTANRAAIEPTPDMEQWDRGRERIEELMREFARILLGRAAPYNAAKHGLAITVGNAEFTLGSNAPGSTTILDASGPSRTAVAVEQSRLTDPAAVAPAKAYWKERLEALRTLLEG